MLRNMSVWEAKVFRGLFVRNNISAIYFSGEKSAFCVNIMHSIKRLHLILILCVHIARVHYEVSFIIVMCFH